MGTVVLVAMTPVLGHSAHLGQTGEDVVIKHFGAQAAIEAFDVGVLHQLAGLDVDQRYAGARSPVGQCMADQLRAVVEANTLRRPAQLDQFVQRLDGALTAGWCRSRCAAIRS